MRRKSTAPPACRRARPGDLDALEAIENAAFSGDRISRRQLRYHLGNPGAKIWVCADEAGRPAAYLLAFFHAGRPGRLYSLATRPDFRGRGCARLLLGAFIGYARKAKVEKLLLEVRESAAPVIALYERAGFTRAGRLPEYYEDGGDGIKMMMKID